MVFFVFKNLKTINSTNGTINSFLSNEKNILINVPQEELVGG